MQSLKKEGLGYSTTSLCITTTSISAAYGFTQS